MNGRNQRRSVRVLVLAAVAAAGCARGVGDGPRPISISPDRGPLTMPVRVRIVGENFRAAVSTDFASGESEVDARFQARLGGVALDGVSLKADGSLDAIVPAGLAAGPYDLEVVDPEGRAGTLPHAYRVLAPDESSAAVAGFRIDPVSRQEAFRRFPVTITAIDAGGATVTAFNGAVQLADATGTLVPASAGLFVGGRWTGEVEVRAPHAADVITARDDEGHVGETAPFAVAPAPPAAVRFATPPRSAIAGGCAGPVTFTLVDAFGAPTEAALATALEVSGSPAGGLEVFTDEDCAGAAGAIAIAPGASTATVWFRATRAGALDLTASGPSLSPSTQRQAVAPAAPAAIAFVTTPQTVNAGGCSQAATLEVQDAFGNPSPPAAAALDLSASPVDGLSFFADAGCTSPATSVTVAGGATRADFWFSGTVARTVTATATSAGLGVASQDEIVTAAGAATRLVVLSPPRATIAGGCSEEVTLQAQDSFGNAVASAGDVQVTLSAAGPGVTFFAGAGCAGPATQALVLRAGQSTTGFHVRGTVAGSVEVTASSTTLTDAQQVETVLPGPPVGLAFTGAPPSAAAGSCSGEVVIGLVDAFANVAVAGAPVPVSLGAAPAEGFAFHADPLCTSPVTAVTVAAGGSATRVFFRGTQAGTVWLSASASGLAGATRAAQVQPGPADRVAFASAPQTVGAGDCSGAVATRIEDQHGNAAPVAGGVTVALSASPAGGIAFFDDAACSVPVASVAVPAGGSAARPFFFSGTVPGAFLVAAAAPDLATATQQETVNPALPSGLVLAPGPQTIEAGTCSATVTVEARDPFGNPSAVGTATTVTLSSSPPTLAFHEGAGCAGTAVASTVIPAGSASASFSFRGTSAGEVTVTAAAPPLAPASQVETVTAAPADRVVFTSAPQTRQAGACSAPVALETQDAHGNASPVAAATLVALSAAPGGGFALYSDAGCTTPLGGGLLLAAGTSAATFHFRGTVPQDVTVTAQAGALPGPASQVETIAPVPPDHLVFATGAQSVEAGACSAEVEVRSEDPYGNAAPVAAATAVTLAAWPPAGFTLHAGAGCAGAPVASIPLAAGSSSASFSFRATAAGSVTVTASAPGMSPSPTQVETVRPAPADRLAFVTAAQSVTSEECSALVAIEAQDPHGNPSPLPAAKDVTLSAEPPSGFAFYSDAACTAAIGSVAIPADGAAAGFYFAGTAGGAAVPVTVTADAAGLSSASQGETITPAAAPTRLVFTTPPRTVTAGGCSEAVTIEAQDTAGIPRSPYADATVSLASSAPAVAFFSDASCTTPVAGGLLTLPASATSVDVWVSGTVAAAVTVTASSAPLTPASQPVTVAAGAPDRVAFTSAPQTRQAGACSAAVALETRDPHGNRSPVGAATTIALEADPAAGFALYSDAACAIALPGGLTLAAGASTAAFHFKGTAPGDVTVTASATGLPGTAAQVETIVVGPPVRLAFTTGAQSVVAGACSAEVVVRSEDAYGNASPVAAATAVTLAAAPSGGFTLHAGAGCTGGAVTSIALAAGTSSATLSFRGTVARTVTVTVSAPGMSPSPTQVETVRPAPPDHLAYVSAAQARTAGACSAAVVLEVRDAHGNASPAPAALAVAIAAAPAAGFGFYADAACATPLSSGVTVPQDATRASFHFRGTAAGAVTVTASASGLSPDAAQVETVSPGAPDHLVLEGGPDVFEAGACSTVLTVRTVDEYGNRSAPLAATPVALAATPAAGFAFHAGAGCTGGATGSVTVPAGASATTFSMRGTRAGSVTVEAAAAGMTPNPAQLETVVPAPPDRLVVRTAAQTTAAGACSAVVEVESRDPYGNPSPVPASVDAALAAAPAAGLTFHPDPDCAAGIDAVTLAAGTSVATFRYRATVAGEVTVSATAPPLAAADQDESVTPGAAARLVWDTVASPQSQGAPFPVTLRAQDAFGNATPGFAGTATLSASAGTVSCASSCSGAADTGAFAAGVWTGSVAVQPGAVGVTLVAVSGALSGTSNPFTVVGAASRSPPLARFTASPVVIRQGQSVTFDASGSSDYQTPAADLQVSWHFEATEESFSDPTAPPSSPWTAWTTAKGASHTYATAGTYHPRLAVRDTEAGPGGPDVGYATATVVVLPDTSELCLVNTGADVDDGASTCTSRGPDGRLSLREALRIVNADNAKEWTVAFSGPMTISGSGSLAIGVPVTIAAQPGVILDSLSLTVESKGVIVSGLELTRQATPLTVQLNTDLTLLDAYLHDGAGLVVLGDAFLQRVRMAGCSGACVRAGDPGAYLSVWYSDFRGDGANEAIRFEACEGSDGGSGGYGFSSHVAASVFTGFATAVRSSCTTSIVGNTFVGNGTGVHGTGERLLDNVFSGQTVEAVGSATCATAFPTLRRQQLVWQNASDGCLAADVADPGGTGTLSADPLYVFPSSRDFRIQYGSPAKDSGDDPWLGEEALDPSGAGPNLFLGAAADRGGRETY